MFILTWLTLILLLVLNSSAKPLVGTPGSRYERVSHFIFGSLCLLCHGYTMSRFISSSISGISIHTLVSGSCSWICFGPLVLCSGLCLRGEGGALATAPDSGFPVDEMQMSDTGP